jgi:hypothetical protein
LLVRAVASDCRVPAKGTIPVKQLEEAYNCRSAAEQGKVNRLNALIDAVEVRERESAAH